MAPFKVRRDISERKQAEAVAAQLAAIVTSSSDAIFSMTLKGIITTWNRSAQELYGYSAEEMIGQPVRRLIPPERQAEEAMILKKLRAGIHIDHYETVRVRKDGRLLEVSLTISPVRDRQGRIIGVSKIVRDISDRKQAEVRLKESEARLKLLAANLEVLVQHRTAELTLSQKQLRALAAQLNLTEQRERQKLASDLHDYLAQLLALIRIKLDLIKPHTKEEGITKELTEIEGLTSKALRYTRTLIAQLSPPGLEEVGLTKALQWLAEQMQEQNLSVVIQAADIPSLPEDQELLLFQSVRELLMNCVKHARVRQATVIVEQVNESLHITVSDSGVGFDVGVMDALVNAEGTMTRRFGLFSIRERMRSLGGHFEIKTAPGKGTVATLVLPIVNISKPAIPNNQLSDRDDSITEKIQRRNGTKIKRRKGTRIRVLVADDHAIVRQGVSGLLSEYEDIEVVGQATNGEEAVEMGKRLQPDVFVMDITMPKLDGIEATRRIKKQQPTAVVIGLSIHNLVQVEEAMKYVGAAALLNKETAVENLYDTIRAFQP